MEIEPSRMPLAEQATQQEDTTREFEARTEAMAHRRTTVTVERETLSFIIRRPIVETAETNPAEANHDLDSNQLTRPAE